MASATKTAIAKNKSERKLAPGPKRIGEQFAWMEGILLLAVIAQKWKLRLVPGHPVKPQPLITLRPKHGMKMVVEGR
jgi:cytochrome P450